ncbi:MAG TPA: hypothetical protein VM597_09280 [Gemmataceae bacterium]|nr:hypothetical protein [Gemmataceae bacterium]
MRPILLALVAALPLTAADIDVGVIDQKAPKKDAVTAPKADAKVGAVDLRGTVAGKAAKDEKRSLYVIVAPLGTDGKAETWWVQGEVETDKDGFTAAAQFGEEAAGAGEFFAVVAVATDKKWSVAETLTELPADAGYSKVVIVKRK